MRSPGSGLPISNRFASGEAFSYRWNTKNKGKTHTMCVLGLAAHGCAPRGRPGAYHSLPPPIRKSHLRHPVRNWKSAAGASHSIPSSTQFSTPSYFHLKITIPTIAIPMPSAFLHSHGCFSVPNIPKSSIRYATISCATTISITALAGPNISILLITV